MGLLQQLDIDILIFIQEHLRVEALNGVFKFITTLGDSGIFWVVLSLILIIPKKTRIIGITSILAILIGALFTNVILKNAVGRIRPYETYEQIILLAKRAVDYSFPSGHSCASFASATALMLMLKKRYAIPFLILAILIAYSRLYLGVHYPSDVIFGILIGVGAAYGAVCISKKTFGKEFFLEKEKSGIDVEQERSE